MKDNYDLKLAASQKHEGIKPIESFNQIIEKLEKLTEGMTKAEKMMVYSKYVFHGLRQYARADDGPDDVSAELLIEFAVSNWKINRTLLNNRYKAEKEQVGKEKAVATFVKLHLNVGDRYEDLMGDIYKRYQEFARSGSWPTITLEKLMKEIYKIAPYQISKNRVRGSETVDFAVRGIRRFSMQGEFTTRVDHAKFD